MLARICDRCGAQYETNPAGAGMREHELKVNRIELQKVKENETKYSVLNGERFDLCPTCVDKLRNWLKEGGRNEDL